MNTTKTPFTLVINSGPMSLGVQSALQFANAVIKQDHTVFQIFFYGDGVYCCSSLLTPMSDEFNSFKAWQKFAQTHNVKLNVCIASAMRRGLINEQEAKNNSHSHHNILPPFTLSGLGQLAKTFDATHKIIQFGR